MLTILQKTISTQRHILIKMLKKTISQLVLVLAKDISNPEKLEEHKYLSRKRPSFKKSPAGLNVFLFDLTQLVL